LTIKVSNMALPGGSLNGASVLVTGGTGSFGQQLVRTLLERYDLKRLVVFSRDELKQSLMAQSDHAVSDANRTLRFFLGDVRDGARLHRAMEGIDTVVHAAALKQVPAGEYNPQEFVKTNILGAQNVIDAALDSGVRRVVALSTDKAAAPINLYGATKLVSDKLFVSANAIKGPRDLRFTVVRYGNVMGSRGSVVPFFLERARSGVLPITDERMTRFNISLTEGVDLVLWALEHARGSEILVPKIPSFRITDLAEAIAPSAERQIVGIRPGEKLHEEMITSSDSFSTVDLGPYYAILPSGGSRSIATYAQATGASVVEPGFRYSSDRNETFLDVEELRDLIRRHVDPAFQPV
jgi:UDP-N-acetylglucosamine 4,6-dehydratase/5-epimerase